ncbi:MAG: hypothetical protein WAP51_03240 [Candidatus Sungiibacteriota bacterium]
MKTQISVEFIDSATNEKLTRRDLKARRLLRLHRAFELLGRQWAEKEKFKDYPRPVRFVLYYIPRKYMREYMVEFENFPSISWFVASDVANKYSPEWLARDLGDNIMTRIRIQQSSPAGERPLTPNPS